MRKLFSRSSYLLLGAAIFMVGFFVIAGSQPAQAAAGDVKVTLTREGDTAAVSGATVEVLCTGGAYTQLTGSPTTNGSGIVQAAPQAASDCGNGENLDVRVSLDGYVTKTTTGFTYVAATDPNDYSVTGLQFAFKVTGVADELSGALSTVTIATGTALAVPCTEGGGAWYCPVPLAHTAILISAAKDGYVTNTSNSFSADRTSATDAQQTKAVTGVLFSHKFLVVDELGAALTVTSATAGSASVACTISTSTAYCPVLLAQDNTVANGLIAAKDGYVTTTASDVPLASNRTAATDAQGVTTMTTANGLDFAVKVTVTSASNNAALSGGTVILGDSFGVTCTEDGTTGIFYCIAPLVHTATDVRSTRNDYNVKNGTYADRTGATDAQTAIALAMVAFVNPGGGSGGGGGTQGGATGFAVTPPVIPAPSQEVVQPAPITPAPIAPAPVLKMETQLAAKADEARALLNFKLLYGRSANLKNATDRVMINIMSNGVIKNLKRDLKAEQKAIVKFRNTFGFLPKLARHWNIIRAIAYSGLTK